MSDILLKQFQREFQEQLWLVRAENRRNLMQHKLTAEWNKTVQSINLSSVLVGNHKIIVLVGESGKWEARFKRLKKQWEQTYTSCFLQYTFLQQQRLQ
jgi:hypothetical protein